MSNKSDGTLFEEECAKRLNDKGFWVHLLQQNKAGQPADILAVNKKGAFLIDAKKCKGHIFPLYRVEANQYLAMTRWNKRANEHTYFFIGFGNGETYAVKFSEVSKLLADKHKRLTEEECKTFGMELGDWLNIWS